MSDQLNLFGTSGRCRSSLPDAELDFDPDFLGAPQADSLLKKLQRELHWEQSTLQMYGKPVRIPRLNAWYGDTDCDYSYSGMNMVRHDWCPELMWIRQRVEEASGVGFNSVLANCYRDGSDSVGWHSDDEPELGENPIIASVSLGVTRRFVMKHRRRKDIDHSELQLSHGSLLIMSGPTQHFWYHSVPKQRGVKGARINLTFRTICN